MNPDTTELYVAGTWGPATLKYSHAVTNLFGFSDSKNSYYLDLNATFDIGLGPDASCRTSATRRSRTTPPPPTPTTR